MAEMMRRFVLARRPSGFPVEADFRLEEVPLPAPGPGEVLVQLSHFSLDPYMRGRMDYVQSYTDPQELDHTMGGGGVGQVIASQDPGFRAGDLVFGMFGWATHGCLPGRRLRKLAPHLPPSTALGVLGMPGFTAWSGLRAHGRMAPGETLVVGACTGPVGSMVGQLAREAGLHTVGITSGPEKRRLALETFRFDACLDRLEHDTILKMMEAMHEVCPKGVDIYFENVGGVTLGGVLPVMNTHGRIIVCGMVAWYSGETDATGQMPLQKVWRMALVKRLTIQGLLQTDHLPLFDQFLEEVTPKVRDGRIRYLEDMAQGLESAPQAFFSMLRGGNMGKQVVAL
ncbi:NADP-dependent oxidoreductase [Pseudooceanicola sp. CBS1P-1]|uniref:Zinc-binding dehydrogenase n=1 Tax=Pseudooceanicola albus TaxID=2692189 RepID=A0A6L7G694_9RHOB|nr:MULTISPECIES: NADP-dependent oxidoreductase [Pseudooceanicola]MBT9384066.1 NADP-dependent oxidoreductase [Pseudooceanicola endophyticus]MXN19834.1 zinc-binding dehydrogenase [Pseudooceanicola albus]